AAEEVTLAREFGAPGALGVALRAAGLVAGTTEGRDLLRDAVTELDHSSARLELARALTDYGACLRRGGERHAARAQLRRALDLAHRCGAPPPAYPAPHEPPATRAPPPRAPRAR